jgi:hypothetical protein
VNVRRIPKNTTILLVVSACTLSLLLLVTNVAAQTQPGDVVNCGPMVNFSQSPGYASADPFILADRSGVVHLFWVERTTGAPDEIPNMPDTLMYSAWNGETWSKPVDLFLSPSEYANKRVGAIRGVVDDRGYIHLTWIGPDNTFFYSHVHASQAGQSSNWTDPQIIAYDQSGSQYSGDITFAAPDTLHIVYGRDPEEWQNQMLVHILSTDGGQTWTTPQAIYNVPYIDRGVSNVRAWVPKEGKLFVTWTEWDASGNGQVIYSARSLNNGRTWEPPVILDERQGIEYERDWVTLAPLDENQLIVFWEGGYRAYRQAQYSQDGGVTWSEPIDTLDWLIADNGFAEFVRDGAGRLHLFVFQRIREGNVDRNLYGVGSNGLWHSTWEGDTTWRQPKMIGQPNSGNFVSVAVRGGNELFATWFSYIDLELYIIQCQFEDTPSIPFVTWDEPPPLMVESTEQDLSISTQSMPASYTQPLPVESGVAAAWQSQPILEQPNLDSLIFWGVIPTLILILTILLLHQQLKRRNV